MGIEISKGVMKSSKKIPQYFPKNLLEDFLIIRDQIRRPTKNSMKILIPEIRMQMSPNLPLSNQDT